jgi:serpin B
MNLQKLNSVNSNFIQRRYGVSLGRRYALAAASVMLLSVFGFYPVDNTNSVLSKSDLQGSDTNFI